MRGGVRPLMMAVVPVAAAHGVMAVVALTLMPDVMACW
jgi:hypothetical protein